MGNNMIIGQSGGPTAVINSSLAGAIEYAFSREEIGTVYGMINGIQGLLDDNIMNLTERFADNTTDLKRLTITPAMYLGSCRYKLSDDEKEMKRVVDALKKYDIGYFFYIGGNDSMDTVYKLAKYVEKKKIDIKVIGIPKTIDNDLCGIDHSPGFGSAAKYISLVVRNVAYDTSIYSIKSVHIIETMGRDAGWIAASSALARTKNMVAPHLIYLPEVPFSVEQFVHDVKNKLNEYNSVIVVVSEGIRDSFGNYISANSANVDKFGHSMLSGVGAYLKAVVEERIGCKVRALEPGVLQRSAGHSASLTDTNEAYNLGLYAVKSALEGKNGVFATLKRTSNTPYTVEYSTQDIAVVANQVKTVPRGMINAEGNDVNKNMLEYLRPLASGINPVPYIDGLPAYLDMSHLDTLIEQEFTNDDENV